MPNPNGPLKGKPDPTAEDDEERVERGHVRGRPNV